MKKKNKNEKKKKKKKTENEKMKKHEEKIKNKRNNKQWRGGLGEAVNPPSPPKPQISLSFGEGGGRGYLPPKLATSFGVWVCPLSPPPSTQGPILFVFVILFFFLSFFWGG